MYERYERTREDVDYRDYDFMPIKQEIIIDSGYKMKWPQGYWEEYEGLRQKAMEMSKALNAHVVMRLNGRYNVYALLPARATGPDGKVCFGSGSVWGPPSSDRLGAWKGFIEKFMVIPPTILAPLPGKPKLGIRMEDKIRHDGWVNEVNGVFVTPIEELTVREPKKSRGRK